MKCKRCHSYAINHHCHGRDGSGEDLCDVCYWRNIAEKHELNAANGRIELLMSANADVARIAGERDAAEKRIKRLEAELEQTKQDRNAIAKNTREPLLLQLDHANDRIKRLEEAGSLALGYAAKGDLESADEVWDKAKEAKL